MDINQIRRQNIQVIVDNMFAGNRAAFAKKIDKAESQVYRIFNVGKNGRNVSTKTARHIEDKLGLTIGSIDVLNEMDSDNTEPTNIAESFIPVISWVQAGEYSEAIDIYEVGYAEEHVPRINGGKMVYGLYVRGNSMTAPEGVTPTFPEGYIIHVDPEQDAKPNDFVIAKLTEENLVTFKQLKQGDKPYLLPLNPDHKPIYDEFRVLGKVIGVSLKL
jgi:SOS-response transcriptional repressor LexA